MITVAYIFSKNNPRLIIDLAVGSKAEIGLDLDWVTPTELEVNGLLIMPTKTVDLRCKLSVTVA